MAQAFTEKVLTSDWKIQAAADDVVLLRKNVPGKESLIKEGEHSLSSFKNFDQPIMVDDTFRMEGLESPETLKFGQRALRVVFYWEAVQEDNYGKG